MTSSQMETLFLEKCGLYAHQNSIASDPDTARVVLLTTLETYLRNTYPSAYNKVMEHYQSLEYFLKNQGREIVRAGSIKKWQNWNYEIMTIQNYVVDHRHEHHCFSGLTIPNHQLDGSWSLFIFYSKNEKRRYEAERASLNRKLKKEQERGDRETHEQNIRNSQQMHTITKISAFDGNNTHHLDPMSEEIMNLYRILTPTQKCIDSIKHLKKRIQTMLNQVWPGMNYQVAIFGSSANSLALHDADVDFCIVLPEARYEQDLRQFKNRLSKQPKSIYNMFFLAARLREMGMKNVEAINSASVPICKFVDGYSGLECDINAHNILGIENTKMIQKYCELDARIRPLIFAVKQFVKQKQINNPRGGTLSSYAYVIMILHFLMAGLDEPVIPSLQDLQVHCAARKCNYKYSKPVLLFHDHQIIKCDARYHDCVYIRNTRTNAYDMTNPGTSTMWEGRNTDSISVLLTKFFHFYSNPQNYFVSIITEDGAIYRPQEIPVNSKCDFIVQDPFITTKNVARSCTATGFNIILSEFQRASRLLTEGGHRFSKICDSTSNGPRPLDTDSMEYRFLLRQQQQQQQRQANGKQENQLHQEDKVVGYLSDDSPTWDEEEIHNPVDENAAATRNGENGIEDGPLALLSKNFASPKAYDEYIAQHLSSTAQQTTAKNDTTVRNTQTSEWFTSISIGEDQRQPTSSSAPQNTLEKEAKANDSQIANLPSLFTNEDDMKQQTSSGTLHQNNTLQRVFNGTQTFDFVTPFYLPQQDQQPNKENSNQRDTTVSASPQTPIATAQESADLAPILNLVKTLMKLQPQAENDKTFESYTSKPCTDMSKLLEDPAITSVKPKDIVYLIAQLNFLGDAVADKIVSNSKTGVVKPSSSSTAVTPPVEKLITTTATNEMNHTSSSSATYVEPFTDTEAGLLYVKQLQEMMNSVDLGQNDEQYEENKYHEEDDGDDEGSLVLTENHSIATNSESEEGSQRKYQEDEEVHIEYIVQDAPEQIDGYEVYNILQWYGIVTEIKLVASCWTLDMVLRYGNIRLLPTLLDFGDCKAKGYAKIIK